MEPINIDVSALERRMGITERRLAVCDEHGEYSSGYIERTEKWTGCGDCAREAESAAELQRMEREREERTLRHAEIMMGRAAIPPRFTDKTFDQYQAKTPAQQRALSACREYAETFPERLEDGRCILLLGRPGTGKTHLSAAIATEVVRRHRMPAMYSTVSDAVRKIKDNWTTREHAEGDLIEMFASPALLVLDEVGHGWGSDTEMLYLFEIVNARYQARKPTIFAGNIERADVRKCLGDRVADRLNEAGGRAIIFDWESARSSL